MMILPVHERDRLLTCVTTGYFTGMQAFEAEAEAIVLFDEYYLVKNATFNGKSKIIPSRYFDETDDP